MRCYPLGILDAFPTILSDGTYSTPHHDLALTTHLKAIALRSIKVLNVLPVSTNIYVASVKGLIHLDLFFFVPKNPLPRLGQTHGKSLHPTFY